MPYDTRRTVSDDTDFLDGLNAVVSVQLDANGTGGPTSALGGLGPNYRPDTQFAGLDAEPCRVVFRSSANVPQDDRRGARNRGRILFGATILLNTNHRLVYADPDTGQPRYLYVDGGSRNAHGQSHHWVVDFLEYPA